MLDSGATHSFVHPRIVQTTEAQPSEGAVLTVTVANGSKLLCNDVRLLDLTFTAEGGDWRPPGYSIIATVCTGWTVK